MRKELWPLGLPRAKASAEHAVYLEKNGWDGPMFPDIQRIANDAYIEMAGRVSTDCRITVSEIRRTP